MDAEQPSATDPSTLVEAVSSSPYRAVGPSTRSAVALRAGRDLHYCDVGRARREGWRGRAGTVYESLRGLHRVPPWLQVENLVEAVHIKRLLQRLEPRGLVVLEDSVAPPDFQEAVRGLICKLEFDDTHLDIP